MSRRDRLPITIRPVEPCDAEAVLSLLSASLGWSVDDAFRQYLRWKHTGSPLGPSPAWVAVHEGSVVGYRAVLRWELESSRGAIRAARAVDVATLPSAQGRGVFSALTTHAVEVLRAEGTEVIFTTPNVQAGAGWIKAGATMIGRLPVMVRPRSPMALVRMLGSRGAASRWPVPTKVGSSASVTMTDPRLHDLLSRLPGPAGWRTHRTAQLLHWRYGFEPLGYRTLAVHDDIAQGLAVFRLRQRGRATEAALCEVLVPEGDPASARALGRRVARASGADYVITLGSGQPIDRTGAVVLPRQGPVLYAMALVPGLTVPDRRHWDLALGDVELL